MNSEFLFIVEAQEKLMESLADVTGFRFYKSKKCLKKTVGNLTFEVDFYFSKWNRTGDKIETNAGFRISNKKYGKLPAENVIATKMIKPETGEWFDITTAADLEASVSELGAILKTEVVDLSDRFSDDPVKGAEYLLKEKFEELNVYLDYIADTLGKDAVLPKVQQIASSLSDEMKEQIEAYRNGAKNKMWMLNRSNIRYIVDNDLIT